MGIEPNGIYYRKTIQDVFIRLCRDSAFTLPADRAASLAGVMLKCHPLEIWLAMPSYSAMEEIAAGTHPASGD